jgi:hypothetical protein
LWSDETRPASPASVSALAHFNERMAQAGVLLAAEGLVKSDLGTRITMREGERVLNGGPFLDAPRLGAGFWIIRARTRQEALAWAMRCPLSDGDQLEVRPLYGVADLELVASELALV